MHSFQITVPLFTGPGYNHKADKLHPYLSELISQRRIWAAGKRKREPCTFEMFHAWRHMSHPDSSTHPPTQPSTLGETAATFDWACVGLHTGSRLAEYGQSKLPRGSGPRAWNKIPSSGPPAWRGHPIAFIAEDFTYFNKHLIRIPTATALDNPTMVEYVEIRFRYDKGKYNFVVRKYRVTPGSILCIVNATLSILHRAQKLQIPPSEPLGMFLGRNHQIYSIRGHHMEKNMRLSCIQAHPDPNHYLRLHIDRLSSHSL